MSITKLACPSRQQIIAVALYHIAKPHLDTMSQKDQCTASFNYFPHLWLKQDLRFVNKFWVEHFSLLRRDPRFNNAIHSKLITGQ